MTVQQKKPEYGNYLHECPYPSLYDEETGSCHHYSKVQCKTDLSPKHHCVGAHCKPCVDRFPSCVGLVDGHQGFPNRGVTALYIVCKDNRTISIEKCPETIYNDVYDPYLRHCTSQINSGLYQLNLEQVPF
ncbi:hypothetical protein KUTeg_006027 [Tegillarca granosa]|uniref:Chitin-binding type-2 domain-containing protein n=1 Tax=Tegillarca granosa TaxID=220873 RepID=A0ABQ9FF98_TEGGR|nr:hypothetical protein KUTeg_006027 [Tegillarca granosa]